MRDKHALLQPGLPRLGLPLRLLSSAFMICGLAILVLSVLRILTCWIHPQGWEFNYTSFLSADESSVGTSQRDMGISIRQRLFFSLLMVLSVALLGAALAIHRRRFALRALLLVVLLAGAAGSLPGLLMRSKPPTAVLEFAFSPPLSDTQRDEVRTLLERPAILRELPEPHRTQFERVEFKVRTLSIKGGLRVEMVFPDDVGEATRDSIVSFCAQFTQLLMHERVSWLDPNYRTEETLQSEWASDHAAQWEAGFRARRAAQKKQSTAPHE